MKLTTHASRNMFGKLSGQYEAHLKSGEDTLLSDTGKTKEEAVINLTAKIQLQEKYAHTRIYRWAKDGTLFALYWAHGWGYDIVKQDSTSPCSCLLSTLSQSEALRAMEKHAEQYGN